MAEIDIIMPNTSAAVETNYKTGDMIPSGAILQGEIFRHNDIISRWVLLSANVDPDSNIAVRAEMNARAIVALMNFWTYGKMTYENPRRSYSRLWGMQSADPFGLVPVWVVKRHLYARYRDLHGHDPNYVHMEQFDKDPDQIAWALFESAKLWMEPVYDHVPVDIQREMIEAGESAAIAKAGYILKTWPNAVSLAMWGRQVMDVVKAMAAEAMYSQHLAENGTPLERWEEIERAISKIWDSPMKRPGSFEWFEEDPETVARDVERTEAAAEKYPGGFAYQIVYPEGKPAPQAVEAPPADYMETIKEYAPFVAIGFGLFRVFFA